MLKSNEDIKEVLKQQGLEKTGLLVTEKVIKKVIEKSPK